jgi:hypothetical protein
MDDLITGGVDADADDVLLDLLASDSVDPTTKYTRAEPIRPHWACRGNGIWTSITDDLKMFSHYKYTGG